MQDLHAQIKGTQRKQHWSGVLVVILTVVTCTCVLLRTNLGQRSPGSDIRYNSCVVSLDLASKHGQSWTGSSSNVSHMYNERRLYSFTSLKNDHRGYLTLVRTLRSWRRRRVIVTFFLPLRSQWFHNRDGVSILSSENVFAGLERSEVLQLLFFALF